MEIKTTKDILEAEYKQVDNFFSGKSISLRDTLKKKWVAVDDVINYLKKLDSENYIDDMIKKLKE